MQNRSNTEGLRRRGERNENFYASHDDPHNKKKNKISLETFDLYQKVQPDEVVKTTSGATVSVVSLIIVVILLLSELKGVVFPNHQEHMVVDPIIEAKVRINFDISFPSLPCSDVNMDAMDVAGEQQNGIDHDIIKTRLIGGTDVPIGDAYIVRLPEKNTTTTEGGENGGTNGGPATPTPLPADYCGSCYGADARPERNGCCNTCDDVRNAYSDRGWDTTDILRNSEQCQREKKNPDILSKEGEGCRIQGFMMVNKVAGNFHIAMGETHTRGAGHIHQFHPLTILRYNVSHIIHSLSFGMSYPGQHNPLDGVVKNNPEGTGVYMYYIKVIPTIYRRNGANLTTNQYSITSQFRPAVINGQRQNVLPGLFFIYDISPFQVTVTESYTPIHTFITSVFAILGGVITLATLLDAILYRLNTVMKALGINVTNMTTKDIQTLLTNSNSQAAFTDAFRDAAGSMQKVASTTAAHTLNNLSTTFVASSPSSNLSSLSSSTVSPSGPSHPYPSNSNTGGSNSLYVSPVSTISASSLSSTTYPTVTGSSMGTNTGGSPLHPSKFQ